MIAKKDNKTESPPSKGTQGNDSTKPVWKEPRRLGGHRLNELFNRYRQIIIELSGLTLTDLAEKKQDPQLEEEILNDFVKIKQKYMAGNTESNAENDK